jgi:hypothetical protein
MEKPTKAIADHFTCHPLAGKKVAVERYVSIERLDGSKVDAEVTWNTVGNMTTKPLHAGTKILAVTKPDGEIVTASWLGTAWHEAPKAEDQESGGLAEFSRD